MEAEYDTTGQGNGHGNPPPLVLPQASATGIGRIPKKVATIDFTNGYEGLWARVHVNPWRRFMDIFRASEGEAVYPLLAELVSGWNLLDDDWRPLSITAECISDLHDDIFGQLFRGFIARFNEQMELPKAPGDNSVTT